MSSRTKRAALYVRVSRDAQTVENQTRELRQVAKRRGWDVVEVYKDAGISGAKGRNGRPGLDAMLTDASRRRFDILMACAIDRLGATYSTRSNTSKPDALSPGGRPARAQGAPRGRNARVGGLTHDEVVARRSGKR